MKKILIYISVLIGFAACNTLQQPIPVKMPLKIPNYDSLYMTKSDIGKRPIVVGIQYHWGESPAYNLDICPDYLDMIIVKDNFIFPSIGQLNDLIRVVNKSTVVIPSLDLDRLADNCASGIKKQIKQAKLNLFSVMASRKKQLSDVEKKDSLNAIKNRITTQNINILLNIVSNMEEQMLNQQSTNALFKGLSIRLCDNEKVIPDTVQLKVLKKFAKYCADNHKYFVVENPQIRFSEFCTKADYLIFGKFNNNSYNAFEDNAKIFSENKFIASVSTLDEKFTKPYEDNSTFYGLDEPDRAFQLLSWDTKNYGGIAIYHSEQFCFDVSPGRFISQYVPLKKLIAEFRALKLSK